MKNTFKPFAAVLAVVCALLLGAGASAQTALPDDPQLAQLVAPIALYPDELVAQILAAATYPTEVVQAGTWRNQNPRLQGQQLADWVEMQPWDPSVKALTQFPAVLASMNANLSWTSALGDAYARQPAAVLQAVQTLRRRAQAAGRLYSNSQQTVTTQDQAIDIEAVSPYVVYVPAYDPWVVYGDPVAAYPGWVGVPDIFWDGPDLYFGSGLALGLIATAGWGWHHWGFDWHEHRMLHDHEPWVARGPTFGRHDEPGGAHVDGRRGERGGIGASGVHEAGLDHAPRGIAHAAAPTGAFSGFDHGGIVRDYAARGRASLGEGFHAGGLPGGRPRGGFAGGAVHGGFAGGGFAGGGGHFAGGFGGGAHMGGGFGGGGHGGGGHR